MSKARVTRDRWDIESNYGYGWDVECSEYDERDAIRTCKEYRSNLEAYGKCRIRLVKHRERINDEGSNG